MQPIDFYTEVFDATNHIFKERIALNVCNIRKIFDNATTAFVQATEKGIFTEVKSFVVNLVWPLLRRL